MNFRITQALTKFFDLHRIVYRHQASLGKREILDCESRKLSKQGCGFDLPSTCENR